MGVVRGVPLRAVLPRAVLAPAVLARAVLLVLAALVAVGWGAVQAAPAAADDGPWAWPLDGGPEVSRPFAPPATRYGSGHRGADLPSSPGAPVRAAGDGTVSYAGMLAGRGVVVVVHGALRTTYEPVEAAVAVGAVVSAGQLLGRLEAGHAGCPVAACLHWGLRRGEDYLDPVRLVQRGPVRLLPVGPVAGPGRATGPAVGPEEGVAPAPAAGDRADVRSLEDRSPRAAPARGAASRAPAQSASGASQPGAGSASGAMAAGAVGVAALLTSTALLTGTALRRRA